MSDLLSKRRNRSITRPRQVAMALSKELTNHSLPEIGEAFGGRDHTTVIHACEKTKELKKDNLEIDEDYKKLTLEKDFVFHDSPKSDMIQFVYSYYIDPNYKWEPTKSIIKHKHDGVIDNVAEVI